MLNKIELNSDILNKEQKQSYKNDGLIILKNFISAELIKDCLEEIKSFVVAQHYNFHNERIPSDLPLNEIMHKSFIKGSELRELLYNTLRHIPTLRFLATHPAIRKTLEELDFNLPLSFETPTLRIDKPGETEFLTRPHQDLRSICSQNCATIWLPFTKVNKELGTIIVYPKTHTLDVLDYEIDSYQLSVKDKSLLQNPIFLDAEPGDLIIMNSFCIHESSPGQTRQIKMNGQIFWNDAGVLNPNDKYYNLRNIPDAKELMKQAKKENEHGNNL